VAHGKREALLLVDSIDRKLVKQTVMTSVYGVTAIGARAQISSRLREKGWTDDQLTFDTSDYASRVSSHALLHPVKH
jgi:DNA-directed RNA polymerase